jgi:glycosyltransferase involved in cell wall biosynthesis
MHPSNSTTRNYQLPPFAGPIVSVIIPAKNEEKFIGQCIDSILNIDFPREKFEVILVDNGSTDSTLSIARSRDVVILEKHEGTISGLRNLGALRSSGSVLVFIDADCTVERDWLKRAEFYFEQETIVCFGSAPTIPANATWVQQTWLIVREKSNEIEEVSWLESMNMFVRKEIFIQIGGFNEKLITCEDVDISYRLAQKGKILSDKGIRAVHHGEAKDLKEFYKKERWRSKSNYRGFSQHDFHLGELPSLIMPIYYGFSLICAILFLLLTQFKSIKILFLLLLLNQGPIFIIGLLKIKRSFSLLKFIKIILIYNIYFLARLNALFSK